MVNVPTRDELYIRIDQEFRQENPDAPAHLSASNPAHAAWRQAWIHLRDIRLNDECNRVYWAENPDAPVEIDPHNPDHARYQQSWLEIRERIMANAPDAPDELVFEDLSYVRYGINNWFTAIDHHLKQLRPEVEAWVHEAANEIEQAHRDGRIVHGPNEYWTGTPKTFATGQEPPAPAHITLTPKANYETDGVLWGGVEADPAPITWGTL